MHTIIFVHLNWKTGAEKLLKFVNIMDVLNLEHGRGWAFFEIHGKYADFSPLNRLKDFALKNDIWAAISAAPCEELEESYYFCSDGAVNPEVKT